MKNIISSIFEPLYFLYQRKISEKTLGFLKRFPFVQYILSFIITIFILYVMLVGF
ncbi:MAG: hypothetical protein WCR19_03360 [Acholeplasmataceae bacterium]